MLNRIYIIVGTLAIIVLAGAFIAPYFISWSDYRTRMEELATAMLGTPVTVRGDIDFSLLPQPRLLFADVLVGSPEEPAATVDNVEAEFSLMEFLRDDYRITKLVLRQPVIDFTIDESGFFGSGVTLAAGNGGVSLGETTVIDATVRLMDRRSRETFVAEKVRGDLRLSQAGGPFSFAGTAEYGKVPYGMRVNAAAAGAGESSRISAFLQPQTGAFSLSLEGALQPGMAPKFDGDLVYRQSPPAAEAAEDIQGDLVLEAKVAGSTDRIVFSGYTLRPDENRAGARLTGAASIQLGDVRSFDAVVSGGVFSLPPRDAKEDAATQPYELVRLLSELPAPIVPPMAGRIGIDLAEVGLRGFSLRNLRLDATTDGAAWTVEQFIAQLPGDTQVRASGQLLAESGHPTFRGEVSLDSARVDGLAALWRKPAENDPLFNVPARLSGRVVLAGEAFGFSDGQLTLDGTDHRLEIRLGFGDEKRLDLVGGFEALDARGSALVGALLPDIGTAPGFGTSFPAGSFTLSGEAARVLGLDGVDLVAEGQWQEGRVEFTRLSAADWGGATFDTTLVAQGTLADPRLSGAGLVRVESGSAPAVMAFYEALGVPAGWREYLARSAPADLLVEVSAPVDGAQTVTLNGALGAGELNLRAELSQGLNALHTGPLWVTGALESTDAEGLSRQVGLGDEPLFGGEGSMLVSFGLEGAPSNSLVTNIAASMGEESLSFAGSLLVDDGGEIAGTGTLDARLADPGALAQVVGATGLSLPEATGSAQLEFEGNRLARLSEIAGTSGETAFSGELALSRTGSGAVLSGDVAVDAVSAEGLAAALLGPAALIGGDGVWPEGPLNMDQSPRRTRGSVAVSAEAFAVGGEQRFGATTFDLSWDETRTRLAQLQAAAVGGGTLTLDVAVCCSGPLAERTVSGRMALGGVAIDEVATPAVAGMLDGTVEGGVQFEGTGASLAEVMASVSGEGNFAVTELAVSDLSPGIFPEVAGFEDVLTMDPEAMSILMGQALEQGRFVAPTAGGAFTIAGGVIRLANLLIEGEGAGLAGSLNLALDTLELEGSFAMTPRGLAENGLVQPDTARVITRPGGTLMAPEITLDLQEMVGAILVRANELEVERLEALQAEDAARQRAAAEERNRLIEEQRRRAAEQEAARLAAEEQARVEAEQEAERQRLENSPSFDTLPTPSPTSPSVAPFEFELPPLVDQPTGLGVNQAF